MRVGHLEANQSEMRLDAIELAAEGSECFGEAACRDDERLFATRPALFDATDNAIDRLRLTEHDPSADAVFGASADHTRRDDELRRGQLRGASDERIERGLHARCDHAADEDAVARYAVEGGSSAHVD